MADEAGADNGQDGFSVYIKGVGHYQQQHEPHENGNKEEARRGKNTISPASTR
jgi:hypothetical protein